MLICEIDHLVITAPSLAAGAAYLYQELGVRPQAGGEHQVMGTHNCLVKLGASTYLEVIAINPAAPNPQRPRWFELDTLAAASAPRLAAWVARMSDIEAAWAALPGQVGRIEPMSRADLNWRITIPPDGSLPFQGVVPMLIQWAEGQHPASRLEDMGCSLVQLEGFHPEAEKISVLLKAMGFQGNFTLNPLPAHQKPFLRATLQTPSGTRQIGLPGQPPYPPTRRK